MSAGGIVDDRRGQFRDLYRRRCSVRMAAELFGLTAEEMGLALHYAALTKAMKQLGHTKPPAYPPAVQTKWEKPVRKDSPKTFCDQCDRLVFKTEATACPSKFCKAKEPA